MGYAKFGDVRNHKLKFDSIYEASLEDIHFGSYILHDLVNPDESDKAQKIQSSFVRLKRSLSN